MVLKRLILSWTLLLASMNPAFCFHIVVKYIINRNPDYNRHPVSDFLLGIAGDSGDRVDLDNTQYVPAVKKLLTEVPGLEIVVFDYSFSRPGTYILGDLLGHEIFIDPSMSRDTLVLHLNWVKPDEHGSLTFHLTDSTLASCPWFYKISYPKEFSYMGFFDSLAYISGDLKSDFSYSLKRLNYDLKTYLDTVGKIYAKRLNFLQSYSETSTIPEVFKNYARKEIQFRFYRDLMDPLIYRDVNLWNSYPKSLQDTIESAGRQLDNSDLFSHTAQFRFAVLYYASFKSLMASDQPSIRWDSSFLLNATKFATEHLNGYSRSFALAWFLGGAAQSGSQELFGKVYTSYDPALSTPGINKYVDSVYSIVIDKKTFSPEDLLNLTFEDPLGKNHRLGDLLNRNTILIDCWATWCIPCREQDPYLDTLVGMLKDSVQFIAISADQFKKAWQTWEAANKDSRPGILQLHAENGFQHPFFNRFLISSIPRYILITRKGEILDANLPRPSDLIHSKDFLARHS